MANKDRYNSMIEKWECLYIVLCGLYSLAYEIDRWYIYVNMKLLKFKTVFDTDWFTSEYQWDKMVKMLE